MPDDGPSQTLRREVRELKAALDEQRDELNQLKSQRTDGVLDALGLQTPTQRRQVMKAAAAGASIPALLAVAASEPARADAVAADVGTQADPWRTVFSHGLNAGDGQTHIDAESDIFPETASTQKLGDASNPWASIATGTIATDDIDITNISQGTEKILVDSVLSATQSAKVVTNFPGDISTTATSIFDFNAVGDNQLGGLILVQGDAGGGTRFSDAVIFIDGGGATVLGSSESGSPAGRTYTEDGVDLDLAMASGTYAVGVVGVTVRASPG